MTIIRGNPFIDHQALVTGEQSEHTAVERLGPSRVEHHQVAITDRRRHGITHHPRAFQATNVCPRRQRRPLDRNLHLLSLIPYGLARPRCQPNVRGERDPHSRGLRFSERTCCGWAQVPPPEPAVIGPGEEAGARGPETRPSLACPGSGFLSVADIQSRPGTADPRRLRR